MESKPPPLYDERSAAGASRPFPLHGGETGDHHAAGAGRAQPGPGRRFHVLRHRLREHRSRRLHDRAGARGYRVAQPPRDGRRARGQRGQHPRLRPPGRPLRADVLRREHGRRLRDADASLAKKGSGLTVDDLSVEAKIADSRQDDHRLSWPLQSATSARSFDCGRRARSTRSPTKVESRRRTKPG